MLIREASPADASDLADLAERTFRDTFEEANQPADMEEYAKRSFGPSRIESEIADPDSTFLLAVEDGTPIGYAKLRVGSEPSVTGPGPAIELERIYVDRSALGRGVGAALMRRCLDEATERGFETLWLGVWEKNVRAIDFYRRWGFVEVGSHPFLLGSDEQTDVIMQRPATNRRAR